MENVIHITFDVKEGEGMKLAEEYKVGYTYPVFILTDSEGEIIYRWTGYTGSQPFIKSLDRALSDRTTVKERIAKFEAGPNHDAALMLANYFSDTGEHPVAVKFFREADKLKVNPMIDYSFEIFSNTANGAWKNMIPFEDVLPVADSVLYSQRKNRNNIIRVAQSMSRLTRKLGKEEYIKKYLQAGLDLTADARDKKNMDTYTSLQIEYALQVDNDTIKAITAKKSSMGSDWLDNPEKFYGLAAWCLERKVSLSEAETLARKAIQFAKDGDFKGEVLNTAAGICFARGRLEDAIQFINLAIEQDPGNTKYMDTKDLYLEQWGKK